METIRLIPLTKNSFTIVDADLFDWLSQWDWKLSPEGYAYRYQKKGFKLGNSKVYLHVVINATPEGFKTDHINGFRLDNRRMNLRTANKYQNARNAKKHQRGKVHSQHKGVWRTKRGTWVSQITSAGVHKHIGTYSTESEAAAAYNLAAKSQHGDFARLNVLN